MMKKYLILLFVAGIPSLSFAENLKYGLSAAIGSFYEFRVPIELTEAGILVEPYIAHMNRKTKESDDAPSKYGFNEAGVSVSKLFNSTNKIYSQVGLEIGYKQEIDDNGYINKNSGDDVSGKVSKGKYKGYTIATKVGIFYKLNDNIHFGVESKLKYESIKGKDNISRSEFPDYEWTKSVSDVDKTGSEIFTQIVLRSFF